MTRKAWCRTIPAPRTGWSLGPLWFKEGRAVLGAAEHQQNSLAMRLRPQAAAWAIRSCLLFLPGYKARCTWKGCRAQPRELIERCSPHASGCNCSIYTHRTGCLLPCSVFAAIEKLPCNGLRDICHLCGSVLSQGCHRNEPCLALCAEMTNVTCLPAWGFPGTSSYSDARLGSNKTLGECRSWALDWVPRVQATTEQ